MAVTWFSSLDAGEFTADDVAVGNGSPAYDTSIKRTGPRSVRFDVASGAGAWLNPTAAASTNYLHFGLYLATLPTVQRGIVWPPGGSSPNLRLNPDGTLSYYSTGSTLIGTTATALSTGQWYWIGVRRSTGTSVVFLQIDGQDALTGTGTLSADSINFGVTGGAASALDLYFDDIIQDSAGFLAPSKVALLLPISDSARAALWTGGAGGTTNLYDAVNNTPPIGTATETDLTQIEHAGNSGGTTDAYDANMTTYSTAGVAAADTVLAIQLVAAHGEDVTTGAKLLAFSVVSNPAIAATGNITVGDASPAALGTYPSEWGLHFGTLTTSPSVTVGTSPVMRVVRPETANRVASVCLMGMNVAWTPAAGTNAPAGNAAGTGTANTASIGLAPNAGLSSGTGTANAAAANVQPAAGNAAGVGAAQNAATAIAPAAGVATGTGAAPTPAAGIAPNAGLASGTGTANNATVIFSRDADAGVASGTGAANQPAAGISPNAGLAAGTGVANDATVSVTSGTNAPAGLAEGTGTAWTAAPDIQPNAELAAGTGAAQAPAASVAVNAGLAAGTGTANDAAITTESASGLAAGTGTAQQPSIGVSVNAALASGTGAALDATVAFARDAEAGVAAGTGTANQPAASIAPNAGLAAGTGAAFDATVSTSSGTDAPAGVAAGTGTAWNATVSIAPNASVAAGTGAANQPAPGVSVNAELAAGTGTAYGATLPVPVWTTPADTVTMANLPELKFTMPYLAAPLFFELELDKVATFDGGDLREIRSDLSQTGWDFWNGTGWEAVAPTGVPAAYAGNEARHTVQTSLSAGTWYRRVRAGV